MLLLPAVCFSSLIVPRCCCREIDACALEWQHGPENALNIAYSCTHPESKSLQLEVWVEDLRCVPVVLL